LSCAFQIFHRYVEQGQEFVFHYTEGPFGEIVVYQHFEVKQIDKNATVLQQCLQCEQDVCPHFSAFGTHANFVLVLMFISDDNCFSGILLVNGTRCLLVPYFSFDVFVLLVFEIVIIIIVSRSGNNVFLS